MVHHLLKKLVNLLSQPFDYIVRGFFSDVRKNEGPWHRFRRLDKDEPIDIKSIRDCSKG